MVNRAGDLELRRHNVMLLTVIALRFMRTAPSFAVDAAADCQRETMLYLAETLGCGVAKVRLQLVI